MQNHIVGLPWLVVCLSHHVRLSERQSPRLAFSPSAAQLSDRVVGQLPFQLFAQGSSTFVSLAAFTLSVLNFFLEMLSCWNSISARFLQPLPVLSLHFSYEARRPSTSLSNVTSARHCVALHSRTRMALGLSEVSRPSSLTQMQFDLMAIIFFLMGSW